MRSVLSFILPLLAVAFALPSTGTPADHVVVHETRASEPIHWVKSSRLDSNVILPMRIALAQQNLHKIEEMLMSVSHPESPRYAQHFTATEVVDTFAPSEETISTVTNWLVHSGFSRDRLRLSKNKGWIHLNASTSEVESLLNTEYHIYTHPSGDTQIGCHNYSLPSSLQQHIDLIKPTVHHNPRPVPNSLSKRTGGMGQPSSGNGPKQSDEPVPFLTNPSLSNCSHAITLDCLRALYKIDYTPTSTNNTFAIVEFTPQAYLASDLDMFFRNFSPSLVGVRPKLVSIDGGFVQTSQQNFDVNGESSLDLEYAMGLTQPQPITLLQVGDLVQGGGFDNWLDAVDASYCGGDDPDQNGIYPDKAPGGFNEPESCGIIKPPNVVSISYGQDEAEVTPAYARRQCQEYGKLGMMGSSVMYSSGDDGVAGSDGHCLDKRHKSNTNGTVFNPAFPATCPFVTAVGATQMKLGSTVDDPEEACQRVITSGGGFSNIFSLPEYQKEVVQTYSRKYLDPSPYAHGQFNDSGNARGFPDISANGANYVVAVDGKFKLIYGTSASAPVFASMITLINDARINIGKKPVGFLNPTLYSPQFKSSLNDITRGSNPGCHTGGFNATCGWDPVTGLGTPNFEVLMLLFLGLP